MLDWHEPISKESRLHKNNVNDYSICKYCGKHIIKDSLVGNCFSNFIYDVVFSNNVCPRHPVPSCFHVVYHGNSSNVFCHNCDLSHRLRAVFTPTKKNCKANSFYCVDDSPFSGNYYGWIRTLIRKNLPFQKSGDVSEKKSSPLLFSLSWRHGHSRKHIFKENTVPGGGIVDQDVRDRANQFSVL